MDYELHPNRKQNKIYLIACIQNVCKQTNCAVAWKKKRGLANPFGFFVHASSSTEFFSFIFIFFPFFLIARNINRIRGWLLNLTLLRASVPYFQRMHICKRKTAKRTYIIYSYDTIHEPCQEVHQQQPGN